MGALFTSASSQNLLASTLSPRLTSTGLPFTVGFWVLPGQALITQYHFCFSDTGTTNNYFGVNNTGNIGLVGAAGGAASTLTSSFSVVANVWYYVVARFIGSLNRRLAVYDSSTGAVSLTSNTATARAPTGLDTLVIGSRTTSAGADAFLDGSIAEFWMTNTDIQPDAADLKTDTLLRLAFGGPLSINIAKDLVEYRSFFGPVASNTDMFGESLPTGMTWANTNGVILGRHPPLPYWYVKPNQVQTELVI